jgi:hypothetical protein
MHITKQMSLIVTGFSLVGLLAGCGSGATASSAHSSDPSATNKPAASAAASNASASSSQTPSAASGSSSVTVNTTAVKTQPQKPNYHPPLLTLLKIDNDTLQKDLKSGKSLADVANAQGVTEQQVIDMFVNEEKDVLDKQVADGKLSNEKETTRLTYYQNQMKKVVETHSKK